MVLLESYLRSFKVIQPSSYLNDPAIIKPKNNTFYFNVFVQLTDLNIILLLLLPYLSVMYSGGILHTQSHTLCTETLLHLIQSTSLLAVICLQ